jgi:hypothetical protein
MRLRGLRDFGGCSLSLWSSGIALALGAAAGIVDGTGG